MDLSGLSAISQAETSNAISIAVARKALDAARLEGASAVDLIKSAAQTQNATVDSNGHIDVVA